MENNMGSNCSCGNNCNCLACDMCHTRYNKHHMYILRKFFLLALMIVIFCFGVQMGQLRSMKYSFRGGEYGMMKWGDKNAEYGPGMMKIELNPETSPATQ